MQGALLNPPTLAAAGCGFSVTVGLNDSVLHDTFGRNTKEMTVDGTE